MNSRNLAIPVFVLLCIACVGHALFYYPLLPEKVAQHFGAQGQADAWGNKTHFLIVYLGAVAVMAATFLGIGLALPKIPNSLINLPNKDFWLGPERRRQTMDFLTAAILWLGSLTMILLADIFHRSFQVHLDKANKLEHVWFSLGAYHIATTIWCIAFVAKFRKEKSQQDIAGDK